MARRALLAFIANSTNITVAATENRHAVGSALAIMGYEVSTMTTNVSSAYWDAFLTDDAGFELIVVMNLVSYVHTDKFAAALLKGAAVVPVFHLGMNIDGTSPEQASGCDRNDAGASYYWATHVDTNTAVPVYGRQYDVSTTYPTIGALVDPLMVAEGNPAKLFMWRRRGTGKPTYYCADPGSYTLAGLYVMMATAIKDGHLSPPPRRAGMSICVDDLPETAAPGPGAWTGKTSTFEDLERVYQIQQDYGMPLYWGVHSETAELAKIPQSTWDWIASRTAPKGGLIYIIEHADDNWADDVAKTTIDTTYASRVAALATVGLVDDPDFRFFSVNQIGQRGMQLMSPRRALTSSPAGATLQTGYGFKAYRASIGNAASSSKFTARVGRYSGRALAYQRGMLAINGINNLSAATDVDLDRATEVQAYALTVWQNALGQVPWNTCYTLYLHGSHFFDGHDGGTGPGFEILSSIGAMSNYCSDVLQWRQFGDVHRAALGVQTTGGIA